jgi:filamentous hemagglutinin
MNKRIHRLVLDRRRGMLVPAAETTRSAGKSASGASRSPSVTVSALLAAGLAAVAASSGDAQAAAAIKRSSAVAVTTTLPQAVSANNARAPLGNRNWVQSGAGLGTATMSVDGQLVAQPGSGATPDGALMLIRQTGLKAILNWDSFNIGAGKTVEFRHDSSSASTLNYIWSADPTVVRGNIKATSGDDGKGTGGEVILQNTNGVIFANGARVDTGRFVATALSLSQDTFLKGLRNVTDASVVFGSDAENSKGFVLLEQGAEIRTAAGGDVLLIAPRVLNEGRIETPSGQTVMAAGQKVYMATSQDATQRGLVVTVSPFAADGTDDINTVEQGEAHTYQTTDITGALVNRVNAVVAEKGSINLVGMAIKQNGLLSATNAIKGENGAIYLQAMSGVASDPVAVPGASSVADGAIRPAVGGGSVTFGANSLTQVNPDEGLVYNATTKAWEVPTQVDKQAFTKAKITVTGSQILVSSGATIRAKSGVISIVGSDHQEASPSVGTTAAGTAINAQPVADGSRVVVQKDATIDVSGIADYLLPMTRNFLEAKLFSIELASSPLQRKGVIYQKTITFDARQSVAVADVSGALANVGRSAQELSTTGGTVDIRADGVLATEAGSVVNIAGGSVRFADGYKTISLLRKGDTYVDVNHAKANVVYDELVTPATTLRKELGYTDGKNAGKATFVAPLTSLKGKIDGHVVTGLRQRNDGMAGASALPVAGEVTIGRTAHVEGLADVANSFSNTKIIFNAPRTGAAATGSWLLDPLTGSTAGAASEVQLTPDLFMAGGIGTLNLYAQAIEFNAGQQLDLGTKGVFNAKGLTVDFNGDVRAAGGSITLGAQHGSVTLGEQARLTVAGAWANDRVDGLRSGPLALDGGTVSLLASNVVSTAAGSQVDASAGAWVSGNGAIKKGAAGAITVASDVNLSTEVPGGRLSKDIDGTPLGELNLKGQLLAYGFSAGGSLTLQGARLGIGAVQDAGLNLAEDYFSKGGFGSFTLKSWDTFKVAAGAKVHAVLSNQMLSQRALTASSAQTVSSVVDYLKLPDASQRKAVSLDLQAQKSVTVLGANASVDIGKDALIETEAGGSIKLTATQNVLVAGQLIAPGGSIGLNITGARGDLTKPANGTAPADKIGELDPTQAIWLTDTAVLDVHGTSKTTVDALGRDAGSVLGGGTVSLNAARGYVIAQEGSVIDLSGVSASNVLLSGQSSVQTVNKAAGTLNLSTPEGFALEGTIKAGTPGFADLGGTINATVSVGDTAYGPGYPSGAKAARSIVIDPNAAPVVSASLPKAGTSDIEKLIDNGRGVVSTSLLKDAGFAEINLAADDQIDFAGKVDLSAARSIKLDTRALVNASASSVTLAAPVVTLGNVARSAQAAAVRSYDTQAEQAASTAGLAVHAGLIDLVGEFGLKGFSAVDLLATRALDGRDTRTDGEIRLRGRAPLLGTALSGQLNFAGLLAMQAGQIYADSMSVYTIEGKAGSTFTTLMPEDGSSSLTPLSALGALTIHATTINHKGQITQPFGTIDLNADTLLTLGANSLLSVAATGTVVPLGTTVNQASWYYSPVGAAEGTAQVSQTLGALPRAKQITLHGSTQVVDKSARVSAAGGGDIQAWEFIAGVGGPTDYLAGKDLYAVLPTYKFNFAPFDAEVMSGNTALGSSSPSVGKQVVINQSAAGLAAGTYTLLPARYALLPGAYLVSLASDGGKSTLRGVIGNEDSSSIASGYYTNAGVSTAGAQGQRLLVQPSSAFLPKAQYATTSINKLLANQATRQGESRPELPMDAGRISLSASHAFDWRASFDLSAVEAGARAGQFDLALPKIELVDTDEQAAAALEKGYAPIMASALSSMKASSVLLGGTRSGSDANTTVKVVASEVELAAHHQAVELPELLAVSTNSVTVDEGVTLKASGNADGSERTINVVGDAAILAVSNRIGTSLIHSGAARKTGDLIIGSGASFDAPAVQVDASRLLNLGSSLSFDSLQSFGIAAQHLALGAPSQAVAGLTVIDGALLESLKSLSVLSLRSYSSIDLYGSQQFTSLAKDGSLLTKRLVIDSPTIRGMDASTSEFAAEQVVLRNSSKLKPDGAVSGQGAISIMAKPLLSPLATGGLVSADGDQSWAFNTVSLASTGDLILSGEGTFKAQGDLALQAARVTATSLADKTISAANLLTVQAASANAHTMGERVGQGASVNFDAQTIVQQGWIDLSSGQLAFHAAGVQDGVDSLVFDTGSKTWATGFSVQTTDTNTFYGDGGSITAQALKGNIVVKGELDVSAAAGGGNAGALQLLAGGIADQVKLGEQAVLKGQSAHGLSGQFVLDAGGVRQLNADGEAPGSVNQVDALMETVAQGGFQREIDLRIRQGDVNLSEKVTAQRLFASVDAGSLTLNGQIDARAADGGVVQLFARDDLTLNGRIDARSTRAGANGGDVLLGSDLGLLSIGAKASVDARRDSESAGATYGRVILRARRDDTNPLQAVAVSIAPDALASLKAGEITVEAVKVYAGNYTALAGGISSSCA